MREMAPWLLVPYILNSCKKQLTSETSALVYAQCPAGNMSYANQVSSLFENRIDCASPILKQELLGEMVKLPMAYLEYLAKQTSMDIEVTASGGLGGSIAGLCHYQGELGYPGCEPTKIQLGGSYVSSNGTAIHEFGHALHTHVFDNFRAKNATRDPVEMLNAAYNALINGEGSNEKQAMGSYAQTNEKEYWAEMFSSYFCSDAANSDMKQRFPKTREFADLMLAGLPLQPLPQDSTNNPQGKQNLPPTQQPTGNVPPWLIVLVQYIQSMQLVEPLGLTGVEQDNKNVMWASPITTALFASENVHLQLINKGIPLAELEARIEVGSRSGPKSPFRRSTLNPEQVIIADLAIPSREELFGIARVVSGAAPQRQSAKIVIYHQSRVIMERQGFDVFSHHVDHATDLGVYRRKPT